MEKEHKTKPKRKCKTCRGYGEIRFQWCEDEGNTVECPDCMGGDRRFYDRCKKAMAEGHNGFRLSSYG